MDLRIVNPQAPDNENANNKSMNPVGQEKGDLAARPQKGPSPTTREPSKSHHYKVRAPPTTMISHLNATPPPPPDSTPDQTQVVKVLDNLTAETHPFDGIPFYKSNSYSFASLNKCFLNFCEEHWGRPFLRISTYIRVLF